MSLGLLDDRATNTLIAAGIISITLNPVLYRLIEPLERGLRRITGHPRRAPAGLSTRRSGRQAGPGGCPRVVVVGYGPVGRTLAGSCSRTGSSPS